MSLKNPNSLVVVGIVVALLAGTILFAGYTSIIPAGSDSGPQVKACQATGSKSCSGVGANVAACARVSAAGEAATGCCAEEGKSGCSGGTETEAQ